MNIQEQIQKYIDSQNKPKRSDMQALHNIIRLVVIDNQYFRLMTKGLCKKG